MRYRLSIFDESESEWRQIADVESTDLDTAVEKIRREHREVLEQEISCEGYETASPQITRDHLFL